MKNKNHINPAELVLKEGNVSGFSGAELLNLSNGGVKVVEITPGANYPVHVHPDKTEFIYLIKGSITCWIADEKIQLNQGEFSIFPSNMKHALENNQNTKATLLVGNIKNANS